MKVYNNTDFSLEIINSLPIIGYTVSKWRKRHINLAEHPNNPDRVISIGFTLDDSAKMCVIADESRDDWTTALDYIARGKVYVSE